MVQLPFITIAFLSLVAVLLSRSNSFLTLGQRQLSSHMIWNYTGAVEESSQVTDLRQSGFPRESMFDRWTEIEHLKEWSLLFECQTALCSSNARIEWWIIYHLRFKRKITPLSSNFPLTSIFLAEMHKEITPSRRTHDVWIPTFMTNYLNGTQNVKEAKQEFIISRTHLRDCISKTAMTHYIHCQLISRILWKMHSFQFR